MGDARPANGRRRGAYILVLASACAHPGPRPEAPLAPVPARDAPREAASAGPQPAPRVEVQRGHASWYGAALAGRRTASGERFDPGKMTAAHRSLPFGTWVEVTRVDGGARVRVRVTDRGPFGHEDRIIDLSRAAADKLGMLKSGLTLVEVRVVDGP